MAEIEITLPTVQYGNVKIRATPEEWGTLLDSPHSIGMMTATYVNLFTQGFRAGSQMDVSAPLPASQHDDMVKAHELLDEVLGGVTEVESHEHVFVYGDDNKGHSGSYCECGMEEPDDAPWNKPAVDTKPKPWEAGAQAQAKPSVTLDSSW